MSFSNFMNELGNAAVTVSSPNRLRERLSSLFDSDIEPTQSELDAQANGNNERTRIYGDNAALSSGFDGEYTPQVVPPVMESFVGMPHSKIMEFVDSIGLTEMSESVQRWEQLATDTTAKATAFHDNIQKEMERGWAGSAATAALTSTKNYLAEVHKVDQAASLIGNKMEEAYSGFNQVRYSVPHESDDQTKSKMGILVSYLAPGSGFLIDSTSNGRAAAAEEAANEVMRTVYKPVAEQSDTQVPKVPEPTKPQSDKPIIDNGGGTTTGGNGSTNGGNGSNGSTGGGTQPTTTNPEDPSTTDPGTENPGDGTDPSTTENGTTTPEITDPNATTPAGTAPTTPASTIPSGLGTGGAGLGSGGGGGGGGGLGSGGSGMPGAGQSLPGGGQNQPLAASAGVGTGAAGGRAGMTGMGGMGAPGARGGGKDDENEHNAPDYLRGVHEELLGPDRLHVPPVIGGDA